MFSLTKVWCNRADTKLCKIYYLELCFKLQAGLPWATHGSCEKQMRILLTKRMRKMTKGFAEGAFFFFLRVSQSVTPIVHACWNSKRKHIEMTRALFGARSYDEQTTLWRPSGRCSSRQGRLLARLGFRSGGHDVPCV